MIAPSADGGPAAVGLSLTAANGTGRVGEPIAVRVEVRNTGDRQVLMLGVLDGSETATRYPRYIPSVELLDQDGHRVVAAPPAPEDPLVGPLRAADFVDLPPGAAFDPTSGAGRLPLSTFANLRPAVRGVYRFRLVLDTTCAETARWLGRFGQTEDPEALETLLRQVPRTRIEATCDVEIA